MNGHEANVTLHLEPKEFEWLINLLAAVPSGQAMQAGMLGLLPKVLQQANSRAPSPASADPSE